MANKWVENVKPSHLDTTGLGNGEMLRWGESKLLHNNSLFPQFFPSLSLFCHSEPAIIVQAAPEARMLVCDWPTLAPALGARDQHLPSDASSDIWGAEDEGRHQLSQSRGPHLPASSSWRLVTIIISVRMTPSSQPGITQTVTRPPGPLKMSSVPTNIPEKGLRSVMALTSSPDLSPTHPRPPRPPSLTRTEAECSQSARSQTIRDLSRSNLWSQAPALRCIMTPVSASRAPVLVLTRDPDTKDTLLNTGLHTRRRTLQITAKLVKWVTMYITAHQSVNRWL